MADKYRPGVVLGGILGPVGKFPIVLAENIMFADGTPLKDYIDQHGGGTPTPSLGVLTVTATAIENGQTITVAPDLADGELRRYRITDANTAPTIAYDQALVKADGWLDWPENNQVSGAEGKIITVAHVTTQGAYARAVGTATLPAPLTTDAKRLVIDKTTATGVAGTDVTLAVTASDNATDLTVTWTSSAPDVAAFTKVGAAPMHKILTLLKEGKATITAHVDGYEDDSFEFTVTTASAIVPTSIEVTPAGPLTLTAGQKQTITPKVLPEGAPQDVTVTSDHPDIVSVENVEGWGFSLTALKPGNASITVAAKGMPAVAASVAVVVTDPVLPVLPTPAPAGATLDATHVKYAKQALKLVTPEGGMNLDHAFDGFTATAGTTIGVWYWVAPESLPDARINVVALNGGKLTSIAGESTSFGEHAGWNLALYHVDEALTANTVLRIQPAGTIWVDSIVLDPLNGHKARLVFTHDATPDDFAAHILPLYVKRGLVAAYNITHDATPTTYPDDTLRPLVDAGMLDMGVYSRPHGMTGDLPDYTTGDWTQISNQLASARLQSPFPRPSFVASTQNKTGKAYDEALTKTGWPLIRAGWMYGVDAYTTCFDQQYREIATMSVDINGTSPAEARIQSMLDAIDFAVEHNLTVTVCQHQVMPDDQVADLSGRGALVIKQSVWERVLDHVKQLVDEDRIDVVTMRQIAAVEYPDTLAAWDKKTN